MTEEVEQADPPVCYRHPGREAHIRCQRCERRICPDCMRDASVGFHCPSCVAEGAKSVRTARTIAGAALRPGAGAVSLTLIAVNVAAYVLQLAVPAVEREGVMWPLGVRFNDEYWRLLTSAFLHGGVVHLLLNMYALYLFGPPVERALGTWRFVVAYLTSALGASVVIYWLSEPSVATLGASGAVFGLFGMALVLMLRTRQDVRGLLVLLVINAVFSVSIPNVSWQGHLGGFLTGLAVAAIFFYAPQARRLTWQVAGIGGLGLVLIVATVVRTVTMGG